MPIKNIVVFLSKNVTMQQHQFTLPYFKYDTITELTKEEQNLIRLAKDATQNAHSKYSGFSVGAALLLDNGEVVIGNNQENIAYPSGLCAERIAIFSAKSRFPKAQILKLALVAQPNKEFMVDIISPCGACRQTMIEYANQQTANMEILMVGAKTICKIPNAKDLLPLAFGT